jgi:acyl-CoA synthetase (AMP-forming)/AMP-acid ligase II
LQQHCNNNIIVIVRRQTQAFFMNPYDFFSAAARKYPQRTALRDEQGELGYGQAHRLVEDFARVLNAGRKPGQQLRVAVFCPNCTRAMVAMLAIFRAGDIWVPVNSRNAMAETQLILQRSDVDVLLVHSDFAEHLSGILQAAPRISRAIAIDRPFENAPWIDALAAMLPASPALAPRRPDPRAHCAMLSTGGTTGLPKAVVWNEAVVEAMVASFWIHLPAADGAVYLAAAPLTHAAGVIALCMMAAGATVVIHRTTKPLEIMAAIQAHRVTHLFLPPTVIYMMLANPDVRSFDYSTLQYFIYTAAPMAPDKIREAMEVFGPVMTQVYGQAEVPLMGTCFTPEAHARFLSQGRLDKFASCGQPTLLSQVSIMSDKGELLGPNEVGEVVFRGALVMCGYYNAPEETAAASTHGWHHTGDIGRQDEDGYLHIVDRKKDMIITGGFNVFSTEVEQAVLAWPDVQDCAVIGVPDAKWGEAVTAFVEAREGRALDVQALHQHCRERLGGVKAPKSIHVLSSLPRSAVGKVLKRDIREQFWAGHQRRV